MMLPLFDADNDTQGIDGKVDWFSTLMVSRMKYMWLKSKLLRHYSRYQYETFTN